MKPVIVWFRRDLRVTDNTALFHASRSGLPIIPLFIFDKQIISVLPSDGAVFNFQAECLKSLSKSLKELGGELIVRHGKAVHVHKEIIKEVCPAALYFNRDYEPVARERDNKIINLYQSLGIEVQTFKDQLLIEPDEISTQQGKPFAVFTPFKNAWKKQPIPSPFGKPKFFRSVNCKSDGVLGANELGKKTLITNPICIGGELEAKKTWRKFIASNIHRYDKYRDIPSVNGTSKISVFLRFGCISIRQIYDDVNEIVENSKATSVKLSATKYIDELIWREFYQSVLFHFPWVINSNYRKQFDKMTWRYNKKLFNAWRNGNTGYPIIDAGMRQLNTTGWMHNRVRMVVASFLTKDLMHDWKLGARYFEEKLLDIDTASNNGGWQWSASTGVDPKPLRIFNPRLQSEKFDSQGKYIKYWISELRNVPEKFIHAPHEMPAILQREIDCKIGKHYPAPIVEHSEAARIYKKEYYKIKY